MGGAAQHPTTCVECPGRGVLSLDSVGRACEFCIANGERLGLSADAGWGQVGADGLQPVGPAVGDREVGGVKVQALTHLVQLAVAPLTNLALGGAVVGETAAPDGDLSAPAAIATVVDGAFVVGAALLHHGSSVPWKSGEWHNEFLVSARK